MTPMRADDPGPGAPIGFENVWDYPRPPVCERVAQPVRIVFAGITIAKTDCAVRVLETSHPPVYYLPASSFLPTVLRPAPGGSFCEWKGHARYWDISQGNACAPKAGWSYPDPSSAFIALRDHVAVYASKMDACFVGEEPVTPQPGGFYGGWITRNLLGPFKGGPGSDLW